jgi:ABC-2 type transport system ATP-binding protein
VSVRTAGAAVASPGSDADSIVVRGVTKKFTMRYHRTAKQMAVALVKKQDISDTFLAVNDVSFSVQQGEAIGLMGLNGSGKSTLLKLISGVMRPDAGEVLTRGRIAGLIATGAGFHPQLTGRENVFLNAAILGMSEAETNRKFDDIVEFADVGKFLDTPVGHYSSGMFSRLGFAVAVHTDSDIFLVDEVLAVGDKPFKRKCIERMEQIKKEGRTLFYVSHSAPSVRRMCDRVLVLEKGVLGFDGPVREGIRYLKYDNDPDDVSSENEDDFDDDADLGADI